MRKITAAMLAAMLSAGMMTGCSIVPDGSSVEEPTPIEVTTVPLSAETTAPAAETTQTAAGTDASAPLDAAAVCGKWEVQSVDDREIFAGQYGSEDYCRMCQMELFADGTAEYYDRGLDYCAAGTWSMTGGNSVHLSFAPDDYAHLMPLYLMAADLGTEYDLTLTDDTLIGAGAYIEQIVLKKTGSFTERQEPEVAWLSGNWVCDTEKSQADDPESLPQLKWEIYTAGQAVCANISMNGGESYDFYFGQIQPDGSIILAVEMDDDKGYPFAESVITRDGDEAKWEINFLGYGTVYMQKVQ